jgi:Skp family chaperone for outer membrane proteins
MKNLGTIAFIICIVLSVIMLVEKLSDKTAKKTGVVQMDKLVYDYKGMKEATKRYENKIIKWNLESDSLKNNLKALYQQLKLDSINNDKEKLNKDLKIFMMYRNSYAEYSQNMQVKAGDEDKEMTSAVINQLSEIIKSYAVKEGYDVIFCSSPQNLNVGYSVEKYDITNEVLEYANQQYEGVKD